MSNFYIERLFAKHYRQFTTLDVTFNQRFNFITGPNGSGKTSILACIAHCLTHQTYQYSRFKENAEFWTDLTMPDGKYRIGMGAGSIDPIGYRSNRLHAWNSPPPEENRLSLSTSQIKMVEEFCPLFIGSNRNIKYTQLSGMQREKSQEESSNAYASQSINSLYGESKETIKQWLINRYFVTGKEWAQVEEENWNHLISSLAELGPINSDLKYVQTGRDLEPVFSIYGEECYLEELSSGFQAVLYIVISIFAWIESTKPEGQRVASKAFGTVLIDELDVHLHPEWQLTLSKGLKSIFPNLQFIVTTHSPHLLASAESGETIILPREYGQKDYIVKPTSRNFSGWNTDQILTDVMDVKSLDSKDYEQAIHRAFTAIEQNSMEQLEIEIRELENISHPDDSIVAVLTTRLAAMRVRE